MPVLLKLSLAALLFSLACAKSHPISSREYEHARVKYLELMKRHSDQAYGKPEMDDVVALLQEVKPDSSDAQAAQELLAQIQEARASFQTHQAEAERMLAAAEPIRGIPFPDQPSQPSPAPAAAPPAPRPSVGMKLDDFKSSFGDCFEMKSAIDIQFSGPDGGAGSAPEAGEAWGVKSSADCKNRYPAEADAYVLFAGGTLRAIRPMSDAVRVDAKMPVKPVEVQAVKLDDGGYARVEDGGTLVPIPPDQIVPNK